MREEEQKSAKKASHQEGWIQHMCGYCGMMNRSMRNFLAVIGVIWILLGVLQAWDEVRGSEAIASDQKVQAVKISAQSVDPGKAAIPVIVENDDRSPGIRVDSMPFGKVDLTTIWAMKCNDEFITMFLDAGKSEEGEPQLFALVDENKVFPDKMVCHVFGAHNRRYSAIFDLKKARFVVQNRPEHKPI